MLGGSDKSAWLKIDLKKSRKLGNLPTFISITWISIVYKAIIPHIS